MRVIIIVLLVLFCVHSCHRACNYTSHVVYTTAGDIKEVVKKTSSGVVVNVRKAVNDNDENCTLSLSPALAQAGMQQSKYKIGEDSEGDNNKLSVYFIFNKEVARPVTAKVFDADGHEYGRATINISNKAGEAKFYSFTFDKQTDIEDGSKISIE